LALDGRCHFGSEIHPDDSPGRVPVLYRLAEPLGALKHPSCIVFEIVIDLAGANLMFATLALRSNSDSLGSVPTRSTTPTTVFDLFLISPMRPRTAVLRERIFHVFVPEMM
jgi:hypothetical protein